MFSKQIEGITTATALRTKLQRNQFVAICTDGAQAILVNTTVYKCQEKGMFRNYLDSLHDTSSPGLNILLTVVNFIKTNSSKPRMFSVLCDDMRAEHQYLLFYSSSRLFSDGNAFKHVFELRSEIAIFLSQIIYYSTFFCQKIFVNNLIYSVFSCKEICKYI